MLKECYNYSQCYFRFSTFTIYIEPSCAILHTEYTKYQLLVQHCTLLYTIPGASLTSVGVSLTITYLSVTCLPVCGQSPGLLVLPSYRSGLCHLKIGSSSIYKTINIIFHSQKNVRLSSLHRFILPKIGLAMLSLP